MVLSEVVVEPVSCSRRDGFLSPLTRREGLDRTLVVVSIAVWLTKCRDYVDHVIDILYQNLDILATGSL